MTPCLKGHFIPNNDKYYKMKQDLLLSNTFWSGVINYVKASAQSKEALTSWDLKERKEEKTVLVYRTSVKGISERSSIAVQLDKLVGNNNWTIDLDDVDKVLRVVCSPRHERKIMDTIRDNGFDCELLN